MTRTKGRPSKPDELKKQQGTLRPSRVKSAGIVVAPIDTIPAAPPFLREVGRAEFERIAQFLITVKLATQVDYSQVAMAAFEYELYLQNRMEQRDGVGAYYPIKKDGEVSSYQPHPTWYIANGHYKNYLDIMRELMATPQSRMKNGITVAKDEAVSKVARLLKKTG